MDLVRWCCAAVALLLGASSAQANAEEKVFLSAQNSEPAVVWQRNSILKGNFTCRGRQEIAMLGTTPTEIVVGVFTASSAKPIEVLRFSGKVRDASAAVLATETLDFSKRQAVEEIGYLPDGHQQSRTCLGLNLSDDRVDSAHIYWNRKRKTFMSWTR